MSDPYLDALEQLDIMRDRAFKAEERIKQLEAERDEARATLESVDKVCDRIYNGPDEPPYAKKYGYLDAIFEVRSALHGTVG